MKKHYVIKFVSILVIVAFVTGCATAPNRISPAHISTLQYQGCTCNQLRQELLLTNRKLSEASVQQQKEATKDAIAFGIGMLLFWPALFFMIGQDKEEEVARLKGECVAIESAAIQKECNISAELEEIKNMENNTKLTKTEAPLVNEP